MKQIYLFIIFLIIATLTGCNKEQTAKINILNNTSDELDTIYIKELGSNKVLLSLSTNSNSSLTLPLNEKLKLVLLQNKEQNKSSLLMLEAGKEKDIQIKKNNFYTDSKEDSILNYIASSNNEVIGRNSHLIFGGMHSQQIAQVFDSIYIARKEGISNSELALDKIELLQFRNKVHTFNFLFFYGRVLAKLDPKDAFYDFTKNINYDNTYLRQAPELALYKLENKFLRTNDTIRSIPSFIGFIKQEINDQEDAAFLTAKYIHFINENSTYWEKHQAVLNRKNFQELLNSQQENPYAYLFEQSAESYLNTAKGTDAFLFQAERIDSSSFSLKEIDGKLIVIDVWASWCGPCIEDKPYLVELVAQFKNEPITFLSVSIDLSYDKWSKYMQKHSALEGITEVILREDLEDFEKAYNIQSIPRYIFLDAHKKIIDANMARPNKGMYEQITQQLNHSGSLAAKP